MSLYSELIGSFIRIGNFPLEANYIFETEDDLKQFYDIPENKVILHEGVLKIVLNAGEQSLYWVVRNLTTGELEFKKLISVGTSESFESAITDLYNKLEKEIQDRTLADDAIYGSTDHTAIPADLNTLLKIAEAIRLLQQYQESVSGIKEELKATVGTSEDDIKAYLLTLDYKSLTEVSQALHKFLNTFDPEDNKINTLPEILKFLGDVTDDLTIHDLLDNLMVEIYGDPFPSEEFRTLRGIEDFVRIFKSDSENTDENLQTELDQTQVGVGLSGDGSYNADQETYYLKNATSVMNALKILDSLINEAINNCNIEVNNSNTVKLDLDKSPTKTILSADVKISSQQGNGITLKLDGLYYNLTTDYENGVLTVKVNDSIISVHDLGLSTIVSSAKYDPDLEALVIVFELHDGKLLILTIPVGTLIREWTIDNSYPDKVVELTKEEVFGGAPDKLSADVRLYVDKYLILEKKGNTLYVKGSTDNLTHNDLKLNDIIDQLQSNSSDLSDLLLLEIKRSTDVDNKLTSDLTSHIEDLNNPHQVTKEQVGLGNVTNDTLVKRDEMGIANGVATLDDNGKIPVDQLPGQVDEVFGIDHFVTTKTDIPSHLVVGDTYYVEDLSIIFTAISDTQLDDGTTPEKGVIYSNRETNSIYRWDGKELVELGNPIHLGELEGTAYPGNKGKETADKINNHLVDFNNPHLVTKELIGLGNVDNTSDTNKPVSTAQLEAINSAKLEVTDLVNQTNSTLQLHINDKNNPHNVTKEQIGLNKVENLAPIEMPVSKDTLDALNLKADITVVELKLAEKAPIESPVFKGNPQVENSPEIGDNSNRIPTTNWVIQTIELSAGSDLSEHITNYNNPHRVTAEQIGLGNVDNTSDLDKPISNAVQVELNKINNNLNQIDQLIGQPNGIASLDLDGKVPSSQLPSYVDDVIEVGTYIELPQTGEVGKIYVVKDTNLTYRWSGSTYVEISQSLALGETSSTAYPGDKGKDTTDKLTSHLSDFNNPHKVTKELVGLSNVDNTSDLDKPVSTATEKLVSDTKTELQTIISQTGTDLSDHITDYNNPHKVTAAQVGSYTKEETTEFLNNKADLIDGKIPIKLLPNSVAGAVYYGGSWDASTNSPALTPNDNTNGIYYIVSTGGTFDGVEYKLGDIILNSAGKWTKIDNHSDVTSVNEMTGDVIIGIDDIDNLRHELNSKINSENVYTKTEIDNKFELTSLEYNSSLELINLNISNLEDNKADLVDGKVPESLLPDNIVNSVYYGGEWDASTNSPQINPNDPDKNGIYYVVSTGGTFNGTQYLPGDIILNSGGRWIKINNTDSVSSVNGLTGEVTINIEDIPGLSDAINSGGEGLEDHITDYNNPHRVTKDQLGLGKVENYSPSELPISNAVLEVINLINSSIQSTGLDLSAHLKDYSNPHKVTKDLVGLGKVDNTTDLEKPISVATLEALNLIKLDMTNLATTSSLTDHINNYNNPHRVTALLVGLGNVDNTSDLDKPISNATQKALDNKSDINHTHTMTDIVDLENPPVIKGFVSNLAELPEVATGGDKYVINTLVGSGSTRYTLAEYDGSTGTWKLKLLTTGIIASVVGGDVYKLTAEGPLRVLDADDYNYFYNKVWSETKDLIQSIEWDESTKDLIRLKITSKKTYEGPNTDEATLPSVTPTVTYINIEKERFMSSAYSRPATSDDVSKGYASKEGIPVLVIELTTGDEVVIDLSLTMNIYNPVDTSSVDMSVSDWTGDASTSYKISALVKIAENTDAVKIVDSNSNGIYARLDKKNTNSIKLSDDGSLSADLVIDTNTNNNSDISLTIGAAGLSAKFVWGEYE